MPTLEKENVIKDLKKTIDRSNATLYTDYRGLTVSEVTTLRKKLRAVDAEFHIVKNTLFKRAAEGKLPLAELDAHLSGPTAIGFANGDAVAAAKALLDFMKDHKEMSLKAGVIDGRVFGPDQVTAISKLPAKEVLIAQMLGTLNGPITGLVGTLNGILSNFVFTLQAVADKKAAG
jgi:large subunit ribosomal protein L10